MASVKASAAAATMSNIAGSATFAAVPAGTYYL
jgi:hypothetical protein